MKTIFTDTAVTGIKLKRMRIIPLHLRKPGNAFLQHAGITALLILMAVALALPAAGKGKPGGNPGGGNGTTYSLIDLGILGEESRAVAANDDGIVVGSADTDPTDSTLTMGAVYWVVDVETRTVTREALPTLWFDGASVTDVNAYGEAVGSIGSYGVPSAAVLWRGLATAMITATVINEPPSDPANVVESWAQGIADDGLIVGFVRERDPYGNVVLERGALWSVDAVGTVASRDFPGNDASPRDLNSSGLVIGTANGSGAVWKLLFDASGNVVTGINAPVALANLGDPSTFPAAITEDGRVTGEAESDPTGHEDHAVLWTLDADGNTLELQDLGKLARNDNEVWAAGVDDSGRIVGNSVEWKFAGGGLQAIRTKPFLWENGEMINFNNAVTDLGGMHSVFRIQGMNPGRHGLRVGLPGVPEIERLRTPRVRGAAQPVIQLAGNVTWVLSAGTFLTAEINPGYLDSWPYGFTPDERPGLLHRHRWGHRRRSARHGGAGNHRVDRPP